MTKISDLAAITAAEIDSAADLVAVVDMSLAGAARNKKMTFAELIKATTAALLELKGTTDCSGNPNYPAATKGDLYIVSVAGKIGGAAGLAVDVGDVYFAVADNAGGTQAAVGSSWDALEHDGVFGSAAAEAADSDIWTGTDSATRVSPRRLYSSSVEVALVDGVTITPDFGAGINFKVTLGGNRTLANPTNAKSGQSGLITVTQDGTGTRTLAYGANWKFAGGAPALSTAAGAVDCISYYVRAGGTILATLSKAFA